MKVVIKDISGFARGVIGVSFENPKFVTNEVSLFPNDELTLDIPDNWSILTIRLKRKSLCKMQ